MVRRDYTKPGTADAGITGDRPITMHSVKTEVPKDIKKIFISLPMSDRSEVDVLEEIKFISDKFKENYEIIDSYHQEEDPNGVDRYSGVWYLGNSIKLMRTADIVVFSKNWATARGCIIEHMVCERYDIPFIEMI